MSSQGDQDDSELLHNVKNAEEVCRLHCWVVVTRLPRASARIGYTRRRTPLLAPRTLKGDFARTLIKLARSAIKAIAKLMLRLRRSHGPDPSLPAASISMRFLVHEAARKRNVLGGIYSVHGQKDFDSNCYFRPPLPLGLRSPLRIPASAPSTDIRNHRMDCIVPHYLYGIDGWQYCAAESCAPARSHRVLRIRRRSLCAALRITTSGTWNLAHFTWRRH